MSQIPDRGPSEERDEPAAGGAVDSAPIVVGCDEGAGTRDAVALAARIALALHAELILAAAAPEIPPPPSGGHRDEELGAATGEALRIGRRTLREGEPCPPFRSRALAEDAAGALIDIARSEDAAMIVVGPTHRGPLGRVLSGSTGRRVIADSGVPVAVAPRGYADSVERSGIETVCVADDMSEESARALETATHIAETAGLAPPRQIEADEAGGHPAAASVLEVPAADVDLMVIGSAGGGPLANWLTDAYSSEVEALAPWPLLVVAPSMRSRFSA